MQTNKYWLDGFIKNMQVSVKKKAQKHKSSYNSFLFEAFMQTESDFFLVHI